ncbi:hypothetical protein SFIMM107S_04255 [Streptomyces griseus]
MPSVVGLLEQRELTARHRVDALREEVDRIQAEPAAGRFTLAKAAAGPGGGS